MLFSSILISFNGLTIRNITIADAMLVTLYRSIALVLSISFFLLIRDHTVFLRKFYRIGNPGIAAAFLMGSANVCFLQAITNTTVANTLFTISIIPFLTAFFAFLFLKEKLSKISFLTMLVASSGSFIMFKNGVEQGQLFGNLMAILTALLFSFFALIMRKFRHVDMIPTLVLGGLVSVCIALVASFDSLGISAHDLIICVFMGAVLSGVANCGFIIATRYLLAAEVTLYMFIEFALGPFWVWLFLNEHMNVSTLIGGLIIMIALATKSVAELIRKENRTKKQPILPS